MHQRFHYGIEHEGFNKQGKTVGVKNIYDQKGASYVTLTAGQTAHYLALLKTLMPMPLFHIMHFFYFLPPK